MTQIRLVATDLDGTLLNGDRCIPPRVRAAVAAAAAAGVRFLLATGRMYTSTTPYAAQLGLEDMPLVTYNGALVRLYPSGRDLSHALLPLDLAREVAAWAEARGHYIQAYVGDRLYVPALLPEAVGYGGRVGVGVTPVGPVSVWLREPPTKLLLILPREQLAPVERDLAERFPGQMQTVQSLGMYVEIVAPGVTKAMGLARAAAHLGIAREQVLAIGDDHNDGEMLRWAGHAVAMSHAPEHVRAAADYVPAAGPGDGVAEALAHFGLVQG